MDPVDAISDVLAEVGPRLQAGADAARRHAHRAGGGDGHLQEHAVAARVGAAQAEPRAAPADRAGAPDPARRARRRARDRRPADPAQAREAQRRPDRRPAHPSAARAARVEGRHPARTGQAAAADARGLRVALRAGRRAAADPRRPRHHHGAGEVAEFDTQVPHWFGPAGDRPVEILSILGREGERIHVRAAPTAKASRRDERGAAVA